MPADERSQIALPETICNSRGRAPGARSPRARRRPPVYCSRWLPEVIQAVPSGAAVRVSIAKGAAGSRLALPPRRCTSPPAVSASIDPSSPAASASTEGGPATLPSAIDERWPSAKRARPSVVPIQRAPVVSSARQAMSSLGSMGCSSCRKTVKPSPSKRARPPSVAIQR